jgi:diguanylate cyclase (GGDEF)-like protein
MDRDHALNQIDEIIHHRALKVLFQPIYNLNNPATHGFEALIRGPAGRLHTPLELFKSANQNNCVDSLEEACREVQCSQFNSLRLEGKIFLNINPVSLTAPEIARSIIEQITRRHKINPQCVVIEITEQHPLDEYELLKITLNCFRANGLEIAIDDLGAGYSGLRVWSELKPDYVKIDRHFIENINADPTKREFVKLIKNISLSLGCKVIAEGIETIDELETLKYLGISYGQGFLLGKPCENPASTLPIQLQNRLRNDRSRDLRRLSGFISDIIEFPQYLGSDEYIENAADIFYKNQSLLSLPVVDHGIPAGLITRRALLEIYLGRYGRELYAKKPVRTFMFNTPIMVDHCCRLDEVSRLITDDPNHDIGMDFIITRAGKYLGIGRVKKLLKRITEQQIQNARYSNPLTLLPGNVPLHEFVDILLKNRENFWIAYCDLNDFKPYNDVCGYSKGDEIIIKLGQILKQHVTSGDDHIGHIGGDDFIIVFRSENCVNICKDIIEHFDRIIPEFYSKKALEAGGILSTDRRGNKQFYPLLSLSIGLANPDPERCLSHHDVAAVAADAKHQAKMTGGSSLFISRRRGPAGKMQIETNQHVNEQIA